MPFGDPPGDDAPLHVRGYVGLAYRETKEQYADAARRDVCFYLCTTLLGSMRTDRNRFNVLAEFGAIYVSLDRETPLRELQRTYARLADTARPEDIGTPRVLLTFDITLARVADLRAAAECAEWGIAPGAVTGDDYGVCQAVAREVRRTHEAIRYPSATGVGESLAIFYDRLTAGSRVLLAEIEAVVLPWG